MSGVTFVLGVIGFMPGKLLSIYTSSGPKSSLISLGSSIPSGIKSFFYCSNSFCTCSSSSLGTLQGCGGSLIHVIVFYQVSISGFISFNFLSSFGSGLNSPPYSGSL